ncbi:MAG: DUF2085 domain-containing protein [Anaerolineales bacterium]|nr:DUF2085 domain-containing protein [Anaerolineales bacterium]
MTRVILYSRVECHLCHEVEAALTALQAEFPHELVVVDIDRSNDLQRCYGFEIPVVEIGSLVLKAPITPSELRQALASAATAAPARTGPVADLESPRDAALQSRSTRINYWISRHYLAVLNLIIATFVFLPFLAPMLMKAGYQGPANLIYRVYGTTCHQLAYRSFFIFGEQSVYPRQAAGLDDLLTYQQATGLSEDSAAEAVFAARNFTGNPALGYKVALCERDISMYGALLVFGLVFALTGRRLRALPWYAWLLLGILPIGLDGLSQLFSQPPFNFLPYRESTPFWRVLTGFLLGFTTAWFGFPAIEDSMRETRRYIEYRLQRAGQPVKSR